METAHGDDPGVQLMLAWRGGDETAFDRLVEAYSGQVWALLTRFLPGHGQREDLVQEVFLRVIRARDRYQPSARFSTWLYRIVFNLAVNETQRGGAREATVRELSLGGLSPGDDDGPSDGLSALPDLESPTPTERLERDDVVRAVRAAIHALPEQQRAALILARYHELPYAEIAEVLGSSEKAIKSLVHRARESLREKLAPYLQGELT